MREGVYLYIGKGGTKFRGNFQVDLSKFNVTVLRILFCHTDD